MNDKPRKIHMGYLGNHQRKILDAIIHNNLYKLGQLPHQLKKTFVKF